MYSSSLKYEKVYYWVCESFVNGIGLFKVRACYTNWFKAWWHAFKLNMTNVAVPRRKFYVMERNRPAEPVEVN